MEKPLISFIVVSYNQESLIREAVESGLAQTYSPLEIVISDDASKDRTFEVMREVVAGYRGPHSVRLNRNETNLGMGGHLNRVMQLCRGEFVVGTAGDDVSLPERVQVIHEAWEKSGRRATSIFSSYTTISRNGDVHGIGGLRGQPDDPRLCWRLDGGLFEFLSDRLPVVNGCSSAWSPALFKYFGPLTSDLEDLVLSFRTLAIGQLLYVNRPLLKYRRHENNVSFFADRDDTRSFEHRERRVRWVDEKTVGAYDNMLADIETLHSNGAISPTERDRLTAEARRVRSYYAVERQMIDGSFFERLLTLTDTMKQGHVRCALRCTPRALPRPLYRALYLVRDKWRSWARARGLSPTNGKAGF